MPGRSEETRGAVVVHRLDRVVSTIDLARSAVEAGELSAQSGARGVAFIAGEQSGGRGQRGDAWLSPPGGLWLTLAWRFEEEEEGVDAQALGVGLALCAARSAEMAIGGSQGVRIKLPNDLVVAGAKLGGCIAQTLERHQGRYLIASVGLNCNNDPTELARALGRDVTSLSLIGGGDIGVRALGDDLIDRLALFLERGLSLKDSAEFNARLVDAQRMR